MKGGDEKMSTHNKRLKIQTLRDRRKEIARKADEQVRLYLKEQE